jgi:hypothetical protein
VTEARCRGCGRPLKSSTALLAGYGPRCAARRLKLLQAGEPVRLDAALASVALVTAHVSNVDVQVAELVEDADPVEVLRCLASMVARLLALRSEPAAVPLQDLAAFVVNIHGGGGA